MAERAGKTALLGAAALLLATSLGVPAGIITGQPPQSRHGARARALADPRLGPAARDVVRAAPAGRAHGMVSGGRVSGEATRRRSWTTIRYLVLPAIALALPIAASLERLQSQAMHDALGEPSVRAALARGCSVRRVIWRHALRLSLKPVLAIYGRHRRERAERIVRGRDRHVVAGARRAHVRGPRRARSVSRRRLRGGGLDLSRARHPRCPTSRSRWRIRGWRSRRDGRATARLRPARGHRARGCSSPRSPLPARGSRANSPAEQFAEAVYAPPMRPHIIDDVGPPAGCRSSIRCGSRTGSSTATPRIAAARCRSGCSANGVAAVGRCRARIALVPARRRRARPRRVRAPRVGHASVARRRARRGARRARHRRASSEAWRASPAASWTMG